MAVNRNYLPHASTRQYRDRGMAKWSGFLLSEHTSVLQNKHLLRETRTFQDALTSQNTHTSHKHPIDEIESTFYNKHDI